VKLHVELHAPLHMEQARAPTQAKPNDIRSKAAPGSVPKVCDVTVCVVIVIPMTETTVYHHKETKAMTC